MFRFERLFGRSSGQAALDLAALKGRFAAGAARLAGRPPHHDLTRARLADACRDAGVPPATPEDFDARTRDLDEEARRRLALAVGGLDAPDVRSALPRLPAVKGDSVRLINTLVSGLVRETGVLTMELLRDGPLRAEEFARWFVALLGATVQGETADQSRRRLERLDYRRLLAEAEEAQKSAEGRVQRLRELQEEQERRRPRRGKW